MIIISKKNTKKIKSRFIYWKIRANANATQNAVNPRMVKDPEGATVVEVVVVEVVGKTVGEGVGKTVGIDVVGRSVTHVVHVLVKVSPPLTTCPVVKDADCPMAAIASIVDSSQVPRIGVKSKASVAEYGRSITTVRSPEEPVVISGVPTMLVVANSVGSS